MQARCRVENCIPFLTRRSPLCYRPKNRRPSPSYWPSRNRSLLLSERLEIIVLYEQVAEMPSVELDARSFASRPVRGQVWVFKCAQRGPNALLQGGDLALYPLKLGQGGSSTLT